MGTYIIETKGPEYRIAENINLDFLYGPWESGRYIPDPHMFVALLGECVVYNDFEQAWDQAIGLSEDGAALIRDFSEHSYDDIKAKIGE